MRVLMVHNAYQQRGGEDSVVESEVALLRQHGHEVHLYERHNDEVNQVSRLNVAAQTLWSTQTTREVKALISQFLPDVMHVHNTLPLVSPSVYWAARAQGVPVVQTLHNFRLMCPQAIFLREGKVCEDCLGKVPWRAVQHRCYRGSAVQSGAVAVMLSTHRALGTFQKKVSRYIALNQFCKDKFVAGGLPADRISIKPNFVAWPHVPDWRARAGGLFVGRLSEEKGISVMLAAMRLMANPGVQIIGGGAFEAETKAVAGTSYLGFLPLDDIMARMASAAFLVLPSVCYEGFPRTLVEAFASGMPVIASRLGSMAELVADGRTGLLFNPGDAADLAAKIEWAHQHPQAMLLMGQAARKEYESRYTPEQNCAELIEIYRQAIAESG
ncbi:MAG: glycosyltransferase family 4 protein [Aquabacterium sp.]|uniref:glycosyltransferase family 4 protein n=1 Tax=Aquabacterium sp. TaxID=1872578 RepID=UPI0027210BBC|nr:glycosyltransferase family 4 protein [Aquabacterium sp.]MDO9002628.1 glycosyltransferase family 4 protein [Aquabacterium sp.]